MAEQPNNSEQHASTQDEIRSFAAGPIQTNCYAYISQGECMVVDPGGQGTQIAEHLRDVHVSLVVATHGHTDHVGGVKALVDATGARFLMSKADAEEAMSVKSAALLGLPADDDAPQPDSYLEEGDIIELGSARFEVYAAPGHTPGGIILVGRDTAAGLAFVGDTIFAGSCGRTDLPGGNAAQLMASLKRLPSYLEPATVLLSGHGPQTTLERELATNPFLA